MSESTYSYKAYGLGIDASIEFPELTATESGNDLEVREEKISHMAPDSPKQYGWLYAREDEVFLRYEGVAHFLVRQGREILFERYDGADEAAIRLLLLGYCMGVALHQRGHLLLHASAVAIDDSDVIAFVGEKGWGKSTMAAALHARGHPLVTDDILAIEFDEDRPPLVKPAFAQIKLWPDSITASLGGNPEDFPRLHGMVEKRSHRFQEVFSQSARPLRAVCVLGVGDAIAVQRLSKQEAFPEMIRHSYLRILLHEMSSGPMHLQQCARLMRSASVMQLLRPRNLDDLPGVVRTVEDYIRSMEKEPVA